VGWPRRSIAGVRAFPCTEGGRPPSLPPTPSGRRHGPLSIDQPSHRPRHPYPPVSLWRRLAGPRSSSFLSFPSQGGAAASIGRVAAAGLCAGLADRGSGRLGLGFPPCVSGGAPGSAAGSPAPRVLGIGRSTRLRVRPSEHDCVRAQARVPFPAGRSW
jgi:hypothetical protein